MPLQFPFKICSRQSFHMTWIVATVQRLHSLGICIDYLETIQQQLQSPFIPLEAPEGQDVAAHT